VSPRNLWTDCTSDRFRSAICQQFPEEKSENRAGGRAEIADSRDRPLRADLGLRCGLEHLEIVRVVHYAEDVAEGVDDRGSPEDRA
jgi:hypothetical protein